MGLSITNIQKAQEKIENEAGSPTHFFFSQSDIDAQKRYCEERGITNINEFFLHLMKDMCEIIMEME